MSITETRVLDQSSLLGRAYELGELINGSNEVAEYQRWKLAVDQDAEIQRYIRELERKKELYEECQRFGHFHPNYHEALEQVRLVEQQLEKFEAVRRFKAAESALDDMLYEVSRLIAHSVSESIKVPSNNPLPSTGGCSSGGSCSGGCG